MFFVGMDVWSESVEAVPVRLQHQLEFLLEIDRLKQVLRRSYLIGAERRENSAEHSWHLAVAAMVLAEYAREEIDLSQVIRLVLVHDLVEIDAGDTFVYDDTGNATKAIKEMAAAERVFGLLPEEQRQDLMNLWLEFEARQTPEAKFASALDRLLPILHNAFNQGRSWKEHGIRREQALSKNRLIDDGAPAIWEAAQALIKQWLK